jgi:hypothetical protein
MRAARALLSTLVVAVAVLLPALAPLPRAEAAEPEALASITLTSLKPSLPQRNGEITVTGTVTNISKKRLYRPRAYFWRNQAPITDSEGFEQALESDSNDPLGARYIPTYDNLYPVNDPYLDAGAVASFKLTVKVSDLALSPTPGVYLMGVHVLQNESSPAVGRIRVFVPVLAKAPRNTVRMTSVVALSSRPSLLRKGVFVDDHLAHEIAPGGRLDVLLHSADDPDVSFAIDPSLVEEVQAMKAGYQILGDDGSTKDGPGRADAARWLDAFTRLLAERDGYRLLYGTVDIAALAHAGRQDVLQASEAASKAVALSASLPLLVWPARGAADAETVSAADALKPAAVLLSDSSTRAAAPLLHRVELSATPQAPIVSYTSTAFGGGPGPQPTDSPVHLHQRLLAESWIQASTEPAGTTLGRVRVISTAAQAQGDNQTIKAPWIQPATLTQLLRSAPAKWSGALHYSDSNRAKELNGSQLAALNRLSRSLATWQDVLVDPGSAKASANSALARSASVRFRGADALFKRFVAPQQNNLDLLLNSIEISATRRVLTPKSRVSFPITIRNTLRPSDNPADLTLNAVKVKMIFMSANRQRLAVQPIALTSIDAGQNYQGNAVVDARTNGTVRVTAQLVTSSGLPVGRSVIIDVTATQAGTVGWFIAIGAGIVLVGTTALRIRQVTRERTRATVPAAAGGQLPEAVRPITIPRSPTPDASESIDV